MQETRGQSSHRGVMQGSGPDPLTAPEVCASVLTHDSLLLETTGGKTTTTAGLGLSPKPASRPQCYQHRGEAWSLWAAEGIPNSRSGVKSLCPEFLLIPTWLSFGALRPQKENKTHELANICFYLIMTLREALGKCPSAQ